MYTGIQFCSQVLGMEIIPSILPTHHNLWQWFMYTGIQFCSQVLGMEIILSILPTHHNLWFNSVCFDYQRQERFQFKCSQSTFIEGFIG
jgi:hypothetical protein